MKLKLRVHHLYRTDPDLIPEQLAKVRFVHGAVCRAEISVATSDRLSYGGSPTRISGAGSFERQASGCLDRIAVVAFPTDRRTLWVVVARGRWAWKRAANAGVVDTGARVAEGSGQPLQCSMLSAVCGGG